MEFTTDGMGMLLLMAFGACFLLGLIVGYIIARIEPK